MKAISLFIAAITLTACASEAPQKNPIGMANPASVYCEQQGGKLDMADTDTGTAGYCTLPSGEKVEEWALYHRDHR
nr:DUF333 domain-containing protein [Pantoea sp. 201603H]